MQYLQKLGKAFFSSEKLVSIGDCAGAKARRSFCGVTTGEADSEERRNICKHGMRQVREAERGVSEGHHYSRNGSDRTVVIPTGAEINIWGRPEMPIMGCLHRA